MGQVTVVFDTNVLVSAAGFGGVPEECVVRAFEDDVSVVTSEPLMDEFARVLEYEHLPFSEDDRESIPLTFLVLTDAEFVDPDLSIDIVDDPDDDKFLECAVGANADYLISGDQGHLVPIGSHGGVEIVSPREFMDIVGKKSDST
jgi:putative PIN family toxin of toxin-antitoxin system